MTIGPTLVVEYYEFQNFVGNNYPPSTIFPTETIPIQKLLLGITF